MLYCLSFLLGFEILSRGYFSSTQKLLTIYNNKTENTLNSMSDSNVPSLKAFINQSMLVFCILIQFIFYFTV